MNEAILRYDSAGVSIMDPEQAARELREVIEARMKSC
jgi:hypothetical protein